MANKVPELFITQLIHKQLKFTYAGPLQNSHLVM